MKVKKHTLLLLACVVWSIAGWNVLRIGLSCYPPYLSVLNLLISAAVFALFEKMVFGRLVTKHTRRIRAYEQEHLFFLHFFDTKSFLIMAFMMTGGILIRSLSLLPESVIAVFYTGLGSALLLAGVLFGKNYLQHFQKEQI